ncbi:hypothetical protein [Rubrobacter aplysinae]|uniref:hypothetical protein n=1 Tax=Rubrobacter aplysinae TaxID=909625 RepID=UPI00064C062A|nr:hypothetical protein [Rubrobacter aplysinae]
MNTSMTEDREKESARKRARTRSITGMIEAAEECVTGVGHIEIRSDRLSRGGWSTMMLRNERTGQVDYSRQDDEAERVMARLLYRKLSGAVAETGDVAHVVLTNTVSETAPEYHVPKMVEEIRTWALYPAGEGGFHASRLPPHEVERLTPREHHVKEDIDEELERLTGEDEEQPEETFEEFMAAEHWTFDDPPRKLTHDEKLAIWENSRAVEEEIEEPQYMPEDEVRYL